mgnify:CR=1 FL=1
MACVTLGQRLQANSRNWLNFYENIKSRIKAQYKEYDVEVTFPMLYGTSLSQGKIKVKLCLKK